MTEVEREVEKIRKKKTARAFVATSMLIAIFAMGFAVGILLNGKEKAENTASAYETGIEEFGRTLKQICQETDPVKKNAFPQEVRENCARAEQGQKPPAAEAAPPANTTVAPAPVDINDIRRQVEDYFRRNPLPEGKAPTTEQVTAAVADIYARNPPPPGRPATVTEIAAAVSAYCAGNRCVGPTGPEGATGATGEQGPPPTDEQVLAQVSAYCSVRNNCQGPPGADGAPGPFPISSEFARDSNGTCNYNIHYNTGQIISARVPDQSATILCGATTQPGGVTTNGRR